MYPVCTTLMPNTRLKLSAPVLEGRIAFVIRSTAPQLRRISLGRGAAVLVIPIDSLDAQVRLGSRESRGESRKARC
jgi:hypothetical protein